MSLPLFFANYNFTLRIREALDQFLRYRESFCSKATIRSYKGHMKFFLAYCDEIGFTSFADIPEKFALVQEYILYLQKNHGCKNVTIRSYCRPLKAFLRYCYEEDLCRDFLKRIMMPKDDSSLKMPLFVDEVQAVDDLFNLAAKKDLRNYCIFHLMLDCGLRSQEVRHLKVEDITRDRQLLTLINSKGLKSRIVLCPDFVLDKIFEYLGSRSSGFVFLDLKHEEPMTANAIKQLFQDLKTGSGVKRLHAHLLRHTFATSYLVGGGNLEFLRALLGHYDYTVTRNYVSMAAQVKMLDLPIYKLDPMFFTRGY